IYTIPTWYLGVFMASSATIIRHDIMQEYFPDRADVKSIITMDEIYDMLVDYKAKNPKTASGQDFIGWTMTEYGYPLFRQIWGNYDELYPTGEDTVEYFATRQQEQDMLVYLNKLYREGFMDPDMFLNTQDERNAKLSNESCIITMDHQAGYSAVNSMMHEEDENKYLAYYRVVSDAGQDGYRAHSPFGGNGTVIMTACKDVERALEFIDFCCEPKNNFMLCAGQPGTWYDEVDGKVVPNIEALQAEGDLWARFRKVGAYKYVGWLREGPDPRLGDYWTYNASSLIHFSWAAELDYSQNHRIINWDEEDLTNPGYFIGIAVDASSDEGIIKQKIDDIYNRAFPDILRAESETKAMEIYNKAIDEMTAAGLDKYLEAIAPRFFARKAAIDAVG
ncbi:MAG: extracellular solute-binding protein, partial [Clostridiales bacterium]|nr:extracellular solute-binding protein [Clostridiales bacterium]